MIRVKFILKEYKFWFKEFLFTIAWRKLIVIMKNVKWYYLTPIEFSVLLIHHRDNTIFIIIFYIIFNDRLKYFRYCYENQSKSVFVLFAVEEVTYTGFETGFAVF